MGERSALELSVNQDVREQMLIELAGSDTKEAEVIRRNLMADRLNVALECKDDDGVSIQDRILAKYLSELLNPEHEVTSKDMLALQKLKGEEVTRSQSVKVNVKTEDTTGDFLKKVANGKR